MIERSHHPRAVVLLVAPGGFGKSTLVEQWSREVASRVVHVSLDRRHDDLAVFLDSIARTIDASAGAASIEALLDRIEHAGAIAMAFDNYDAIASERVHAAMTTLLEHRPPAARVVVASRSEPPFSIARPRARRELGFVRENDLRFSHGEVDALFRRLGVPLDDDAVDAVTAATGGWIAGLRMAARVMESEPDRSRFLDALVAGPMVLQEEVISREPERVQRFLLRTSILASLDPAICDAVVEEEGSAELLESLAAQRLYVCRSAGGEYEFSCAFRDFLSALLWSKGPVGPVHGRAAVALEAAGKIPEAIQHAIAGGEVHHAIRLIERHSEVLIASGRRESLQAWLDMLPPGLVKARCLENVTAEDRLVTYELKEIC